MEMDFYWVKKAGQDPLHFLKNIPDRFPLWHVKDMDNTPKKFYISRKWYYQFQRNF